MLHGELREVNEKGKRQNTKKGINTKFRTLSGHNKLILTATYLFQRSSSSQSIVFVLGFQENPSWLRIFLIVLYLFLIVLRRLTTFWLFKDKLKWELTATQAALYAFSLKHLSTLFPFLAWIESASIKHLSIAGDHTTFFPLCFVFLAPLSRSCWSNPIINSKI